MTNLSNRGKPAVLGGPERIGKTWLFKHIIGTARAKGWRIFELNMGLLTNEDLLSLDSCLLRIAYFLLENINNGNVQIDEIWNRPQPATFKLKIFIKDWILKQTEVPILLAIDQADRIWGKTYQDDFFSMLRAWAESGNDAPWSQLRMLLTISNTPRQLIKDALRSPFNITEPIMLGDLDMKQTRALARLHDPNWDDHKLVILRELVGGHPYLLRLVMSKIRPDQIEEVGRSGLFEQHLRNLRKFLADNELLEEARKAVRDPRYVLNEEYEHRLISAGIIIYDGERHYKPRYTLYDEFLRKQ